MKIKTKMILTVVLCLALGTVVLMQFVNQSYRTNVELVATQATATAQKSIANLERDDVKTLSSTLAALMTNDEIRSAYIARDRQKLIALTGPLYRDIKKRFAITHWLFIDTEATKKVFLRLQKPEQYDDVRKTITYKQAVKNKAYAAGKDLGKNGFALRVVAPYYDEAGKLIGYMELGEKADRFLSSLKSQTSDEYGLVVLKKKMDHENYALGRKAVGLKDNWGDQKDVVVIDQTKDSPSLVAYNKDLSTIPATGMMVEQVVANGRATVRGAFPIYDAADKQIGAVFVEHDITKLYNGMKSVQTKMLAAVVCLMIVASLIILSIMSKLVFARLKSTMNVATRVVGGEFETQIVPASNDEVGELESLLEQFRQVFVNTVKDMEELYERLNSKKSA